VVLTLDPPRKLEAWREPVRLRFPVVVWEHGTDAALARVPGLDIEVIAPDRKTLDERLEAEIVAALRRGGHSAGLEGLAWKQRALKFKVEWQTLTVKLPSLKHRAQKKEDESGDEKPSLLKQVATPMEPERMPPAVEVGELVEQIADALTSTRPQSVLLVGPSGVGKTAAVRELVRRKLDYRLGATPFFQTSGARIVAGQCGFGMWQQRCTDLVREAAKKRAVLHLGNLIELMEVGKSDYNQTGLAGFLRPAIARGELLCVAECTPEQLPMIEREDPQLADAFRQLKV
jgi:ATP-dependent Clp protease ATP-binding subunit ClpC